MFGVVVFFFFGVGRFLAALGNFVPRVFFVFVFSFLFSFSFSFFFGLFFCSCHFEQTGTEPAIAITPVRCYMRIRVTPPSIPYQVLGAQLTELKRVRAVAQYMHKELQMVPWTLTSNYLKRHGLGATQV